MRLNEFGKKARVMRMERDLSLKEMADGMGISSAHLSALEYGDKTLNEDHVEAAVAYLAKLGIEKAALNELREAGAMSMKSISTERMAPDARAMVYAFARKLQEGGQPPTTEIENWLKDRK